MRHLARPREGLLHAEEVEHGGGRVHRVVRPGELYALAYARAGNAPRHDHLVRAEAAVAVACAAVVGKEEEVCVFIQSLLFEALQEAADLRVGLLDGADVLGRHPLVRVSGVVGVHGVEEDEGGRCLVADDEAQGALVVGCVGIVFKVAHLVKVGGVVRVEEVYPVVVEGRFARGQGFLQHVEEGGVVAVGVGLGGREVLFPLFPSVVCHSVLFRPAAGEVAGPVGQGNGGHHGARAERERAFGKEGVDVGRARGLESGHGYAVECQHHHALGLGACRGGQGAQQAERKEEGEERDSFFHVLKGV